MLYCRLPQDTNYRQWLAYDQQITSIEADDAGPDPSALVSALSRVSQPSAGPRP
jgi:hypothetical protein